jgi:hypothetical protein
MSVLLIGDFDLIEIGYQLHLRAIQADSAFNGCAMRSALISRPDADLRAIHAF